MTRMTRIDHSSIRVIRVILGNTVLDRYSRPSASTFDAGRSLRFERPALVVTSQLLRQIQAEAVELG